MMIGVLGTGMVGRAHAGKLAQIGHDVVVGTRDPEATKVRKAEQPWMKDFGTWLAENPSIKLGYFEEAAMHGEIVINALKGTSTIDVLKGLGEDPFEDKVLMDISNPIGSTFGMTPSLFVINNDSLAEMIQKLLPSAKVVKTLNTVANPLQVNPRMLANGDHTAFVSGNDAEAKARVVGYLKDWYGWKNVMDLGDLTTARGAEAMMLAWLDILMARKSPMFNFKVVEG